MFLLKKFRVFLFLAAIFSFFIAPAAFILAEEISIEQRLVLENELKQLELEILENEKEIRNANAKSKSLKGELERLKAKESGIKLKIKAVKIQIENLGQEIDKKIGEIQVTENKISSNKKALTQSLQRVYESDQSSLVEVLLRNPSFSDFFGDINNLMDVQDSLSVTIDRITDLKNDLSEKKELLLEKRDNAEALRKRHDSQISELQETKVEKANLLKETQGSEAKYKDILAKNKKTAAEIRNRIFRFFGGGEVTFEQAYQFAKLAEGATGVRAALILAILDRESALGRNVGRCGYEKAMNPRDIPIFLEITSKLGISPDSVTVSCANRDGKYGGAMGISQFIPPTWRLYEAAITQITGSKIASPWNNWDSVAGTALYLRDALNSGSCQNYANQNSHVSSKTILEERCAAAQYYAGRNWYSYRFAYGDPVVERALDFQNDINTLNS